MNRGPGLWEKLGNRMMKHCMSYSQQINNTIHDYTIEEWISYLISTYCFPTENKEKISKDKKERGIFESSIYAIGK